MAETNASKFCFWLEFWSKILFALSISSSRLEFEIPFDLVLFFIFFVITYWIIKKFIKKIFFFKIDKKMFQFIFFQIYFFSILKKNIFLDFLYNSKCNNELKNIKKYFFWQNSKSWFVYFTKTENHRSWNELLSIHYVQTWLPDVKNLKKSSQQFL